MRVFGILFAFLFLFSCMQQEEYLQHESGLQYYFIQENPDGSFAQPGDILTLDFVYRTESDSVLFDSREIDSQYRMQLNEPSHLGGSIEDAWALMRIGDSLRCKINALDFYRETRKMDLPESIDPTEYLIFDVKLKGIQTYSDIAKERSEARHNTQEAEMILLDDYLTKTNTTVEPSSSGLYVVHTEEGAGVAPKMGDRVSIHYVAKKIDMSIFDSSYDRNQELVFTVGSGEMIAGLEEGVLQMKEGGRARFIIPSFLAYGEEGYGKLIGPFSTLVFEVELKQVLP